MSSILSDVPTYSSSQIIDAHISSLALGLEGFRLAPEYPWSYMENEVSQLFYYENLRNGGGMEHLHTNPSMYGFLSTNFFRLLSLASLAYPSLRALNQGASTCQTVNCKDQGSRRVMSRLGVTGLTAAVGNNISWGGITT